VWTEREFDFELLDDLSDGPVATLRISTPAGVLLVMAVPAEADNCLTVHGLHINGEGTDLGPGTLGIANLQVIARGFMERFD
jgi:hypothetical protein